MEQVVVLDGSNDFVRSCPGVSERLDQLAPHLQVELLKCNFLRVKRHAVRVDPGGRSPLDCCKLVTIKEGRYPLAIRRRM